MAISTKKVASALVAGAMVFGMGGAGIVAAAPTAIAYAADGEEIPVVAKPTLKLVTPSAPDQTPNEITAGTEYVAIQVFTADVEGTYEGEKVIDEDGLPTGEVKMPTGSNIRFAPGVTVDMFQIDKQKLSDGAVGVAIPDDYNFGDDAVRDAQYAAEWIGMTPIDEDGNVNMTHQPGVGLVAGSFGMDLAKRIFAANGTTAIPVTADGAAAELPAEGYYLIVKKDDLLKAESTVATSPIFAALDSIETTITLKEAIPTLTKEIQEDGANSEVDADDVWTDAANHTLNQDVNYKLTGTIADNVDAYASYEYNFRDSWDATKMTLRDAVVAEGEEAHKVVRVAVLDGTSAEVADITKADGVTIKTAEAGKLDVEIGDLKAVYRAAVAADDAVAEKELNKDHQVVVYYTAYQSSDAASPAGIENAALLEYANNPMMASLGATPVVKTKDHSYELQLHKTDKNTGDDLAGVEFSIKSSSGKYIAEVFEGEGEDKVLTGLVEQDTPYSFVTDADGMIKVSGVDADTYTVEEVKALPSYKELGSEIVVTITDKDEADEAITLSNVKTAVDNKENVLVSFDLKGAETVTGNNEVLLKVENIKEIGLPSTGEMGVALLILIAASAIAAGIIVKRRKSEDDSSVVMLG